MLRGWRQARNAQDLRTRERCRSTFLVGGREVRCISEAPPKGETHTHVAQGAHGRITWTDAEAQNCHKDVYRRTVPLIGWRGWRSVGGGVLKSLVVDVPWPKPVKRARAKPYSVILRETNTATYGDPGRERSIKRDFGIFCFKSPTQLVARTGTMRRGNGLWGRPRVIGEIELTGRVVEHTYGYRAEVATIRRLWIVTFEASKTPNIKMMERRYQCEVETLHINNVKAWACFYNDEES